MKFDWTVNVRDEKGAKFTGAQVAVVQASALAGLDFPFLTIAPTHTNKDGLYTAGAAITPAAGDWALIVRAPGMRGPLVQPFTLKAKGSDDFSVTTPGGLLATVDLTAGGPETAKTFNFTVTLFPSTELVFLSGTDYFGVQVIFREKAEGRAKGLFKRLAAGKLGADKETPITKGTVVTLFSCDDRARLTLGFSHTGGLVQMAVKSFGSTSGITPGRRHKPVKGDISAVDFYKYLSSAGDSEPGRVLEASVFSHAYSDGAILFNTTDPDDGTHDTPFKEPRAPGDFDMRMKDFAPANTSGWPKMKEAFAASGRFHVWGCSVASLYKDMMTGALAVTDPNKIFYFESDSKDHGGNIAAHTQAQFTRQLVRKAMDEKFDADSSYAAAAGAFLGKPSFGAPPGSGADYTTLDGVAAMGLGKWEDGDWKFNTSPYLFLSADFSPPFAFTTSRYNHGYLDYQLMQKRKTVDDPPFNSAAYILQRNFRTNKSTLSFFFDFKKQAVKATEQPQPLPHTGTNIKLEVTLTKKGFVDAALAGHLYVIRDLDDDLKNSVAFFLQDDGLLFVVDRDASTGLFSLPSLP
jgi:hypothetical protein